MTITITDSLPFLDFSKSSRSTHHAGGFVHGMTFNIVVLNMSVVVVIITDVCYVDHRCMTGWIPYLWFTIF